jgi:hypothetical protein
MDNLITSVYLFKVLPDDIKRANKITVGPKIPRFDCVGINENDHHFIGPLINNKNQCNITLVPAGTMVECNTKRKADLALSNSKVINLTSLYYQDADNNHRYYGYSNPNPTIKKGKEPNPMLAFKNDLLLIQMDMSKEQIVICVLKDQKHFVQYLYPEFVKGKFDDAIANKLDFLKSDFNYTRLV